MKKQLQKVTFLIVLMLALAVAVPASASSVYGMRGLVKMPIADTQAIGEYTGGFEVIGRGNYVGFNYGLLEDLEVYLNMVALNGFANPEVHGGAKYRVLRETKYLPSMSLGLMNTDFFGVFSKTLEPKTNIRGHIGYGTGKYFDGLFFGANMVVNPVTVRNGKSYSFAPRTDLQVEFIANEVNLGVEVCFNQYFAVKLGLVNFRKPAYGFSYTSEF